MILKASRSHLGGEIKVQKGLERGSWLRNGLSESPPGPQTPSVRTRRRAFWRHVLALWGLLSSLLCFCWRFFCFKMASNVQNEHLAEAKRSFFKVLGLQHEAQNQLQKGLLGGLLGLKIGPKSASHFGPNDRFASARRSFLLVGANLFH